jgi:elongator complex protein 1
MARICWRSDGEFFVLHFIDEFTNTRKFQVFTREGLLHSTIENKVNILDSPISWKYSKSLLIASSVYRLNKHEILFFERNGLTHGSFVLPFDYGKMKVNQILWNIDSTLLCIWSELIERQVNSELQSVIQIWSVANYYWYLKQSYNFDLENKISCVSWDPEDPLKLHAININGRYLNYNFGWTTNLSSCIEDYNGSIGVIDGSNVLITPFKNKIIPPPLSHYKLNCSKFINKIIWSPSNLDILVYLYDNNLAYYKCKDCQKSSYELIGQVKFEINELKTHSSFINHILWISSKEIIAIISESNNSSGIACFEFEEAEDKPFCLNKKDHFSLNHNVYNVFFNHKSKTLAIQTIKNEIIKYKRNANQWDLIETIFSFPQLCPNFSMVTLINEGTEREILIGLSKYYRLFIDKHEVATNCSSYYVHDEYLLFTDHSSSLKFISLRQLNNLDLKKVKEESLRQIEKGSKIVTAIKHDTKCILQAPRGNLESIHPRVLVISRLKSYIDTMSYLNAVETMRKHRVNMNILCDHNCDNFIKNISTFVDQVKDPTLINLFLTELSEEDTTTTIFKDFYTEKEKKKVGLDLKNNLLKSKISNICQNLINVCLAKNSVKYFLVILSCFVKMKELENGLQTIIKSKGKFKFSKK